jgi:hypothetical protein
VAKYTGGISQSNYLFAYNKVLDCGSKLAQTINKDNKSAGGYFSCNSANKKPIDPHQNNVVE